MLRSYGSCLQAPSSRKICNMALATGKLSLSVPDGLTLQNILELFNCQINEEQAWSICYQCTQRFKSGVTRDQGDRLKISGAAVVQISADGNINFEEHELRSVTKTSVSSESLKQKRHLKQDGDVGDEASESLLLNSLGVTIYRALDYGLADERQLSPDLDEVIDFLLNYNDDNIDDDKEDLEGHSIDDEGIGDEEERTRSEDEEEDGRNDDSGRLPCSPLDTVIQMCCIHAGRIQDPGSHYKAVCRALIAEARELVTFLDKISTGVQSLSLQDDLTRTASSGGGRSTDDLLSLDVLDRSDWASLWVQVIRQLRLGVKLKKVEQVNMTPFEYELTPYEILMDDIRLRRYTLNKVMVNGDIPPKVKSDAHEVILDFIRSRPPLKSAASRKLSEPPTAKPDPRELLLQDIRSAAPKCLKPVPDSKAKKTDSFLSLFTEMGDNSTKTTRRKVQLAPLAYKFGSEDDDDETDNFDTSEDDSMETTRRRIVLGPMSPILTPISSPGSPDSPPMITHARSYKQAVVENLVYKRLPKQLKRRHSISVCEFPDDTFTIHRSRISKQLQKGESIAEHQNEFEILAPSSLLSCPSSEASGGGPTHSTPTPTTRVTHSQSECSHLGDLSHVNACDLKHVNWKTTCKRRVSNAEIQCKDCRPLPEVLQKFKRRWQNPVECLSLTLDEVIHIRIVLTKVELESLTTRPELYNLVNKNKVCFTCRVTKFTFFGYWGTKCHFCQRTVCNKCIRKVSIPSENFGSTPVYSLSPSPLSPEGKEFIRKHKPSSRREPAMTSLELNINNNNSTSSASTSSSTYSSLLSLSGLSSFTNNNNKASVSSSDSSQSVPVKRRPFFRSQTLQTPRSDSDSFKENGEERTRGDNLSHPGPQMSICCDCKTMICEIIKASRTAVALAYHQESHKQQPEKRGNPPYT